MNISQPNNALNQPTPTSFTMLPPPPPPPPASYPQFTSSGTLPPPPPPPPPSYQLYQQLPSPSPSVTSQTNSGVVTSAGEGGGVEKKEGELAEVNSVIRNIMQSSAAEVNMNNLIPSCSQNTNLNETKVGEGDNSLHVEKLTLVQIHEMASHTNRLLNPAVLWIPPPLLVHPFRNINDKSRDRYSSRSKDREREGSSPSSSSKGSIQPLHSSFLFSSVADLRPLNNKELIYIHHYLSRVTVKRNNIKMLMVWVLDRTGFYTLEILFFLCAIYLVLDMIFVTFLRCIWLGWEARMFQGNMMKGIKVIIKS
jgi:hypothetical protein